MNRLKCLLTGGHVLHHTNLFPLYNRRSGTYSFIQRCSKCGKRFEVEIPARMIQSLPTATHITQTCEHCAFSEKLYGCEAYYCRKKREYVAFDGWCEHWEF